MGKKTIERPCDLCGKLYQAIVCRLSKPHWGRWCSRHCAQMCHIRPTIEERLWPQVNKNGPNGCWIFTGTLNEDGYGSIRYGKEDRAHRITYIMSNGPIPKGMVVMHKCDTPACVNPKHLKLGTQTDNIMDMVKKGRNRNGGRGAAHILSVLTAEQRLEIKKKYTGIRGHKSQLAREFGVCPQTICNVLNQDYV